MITIGLVLILCLLMSPALTACDDQTEPTTVPTAAPTPVPTRAPTTAPAPSSTLNVLQVLDCVFVRLDWGDYQHITVKAQNSDREYDFWVLQDTGVSTEDLIEGDRIKVTWRTTMASIPEAGGQIRIDEAVKIEYVVPPPKLNYLNCTFVSLTQGDYLHMTVRELTSTRTRDFWVLRDTGIRPEDLKPNERIRVTWRNVDLRIPETIEKLNVNEAVRIEPLG